MRSANAHGHNKGHWCMKSIGRWWHRWPTLLLWLAVLLSAVGIGMTGTSMRMVAWVLRLRPAWGAADER